MSSTLWAGKFQAIVFRACFGHGPGMAVLEVTVCFTASYLGIMVVELVVEVSVSRSLAFFWVSSPT